VINKSFFFFTNRRDKYKVFPMIINKTTCGFVIQQFDTDKKQYISQEFIAASEVDYEDTSGNVLEDKAMQEYNFGPLAETEPYLPFDMIQPNNIEKENVTKQGEHIDKDNEHDFNHDIKRCMKCGKDEDEAFTGGLPCNNTDEDQDIILPVANTNMPCIVDDTDKNEEI
jgi:hypothetical protein